MLTLIVNVVADVLEFPAKQLAQARMDFEAAKIRAGKTRKARKLR